MFFCSRALGFALIVALTISTVANAADSITADQIKEFTAKLQELKKQSTPIDPKVTEALDQLNTVIDQPAVAEIAPLQKAAQILIEALPRLGANHAAIGEKGALRKPLDDARAAIEITERISEPLRLEARAVRLKDALAAFKEASKPPLADALVALKTSISEKVNLTFGIHVVRARVGDLRFLSDRRRTCDATGYFRGRCNKETSCQLISADTIDGICGYEPAPFAEDRNRGMAIEYICVTETEGGWQKLFASDNSAKGGRQVRLQGKEIFSCDKPPKQGTVTPKQ